LTHNVCQRHALHDPVFVQIISLAC